LVQQVIDGIQDAMVSEAPPANDQTADIIAQMANLATRSSEVQQQLQTQLQQMQQAMGLLQTQLTNQNCNQYQPRGGHNPSGYRGHSPTVPTMVIRVAAARAADKAVGVSFKPGTPLSTVGLTVGAAIQVQHPKPKSLAIRIAQHFKTKWAAALAIVLPDIWGPNLENNQVRLT
jgi:hypothetical protein